MSARTTQAATGKYSKVTRKIWRSPDFQSLSPMPPSGQGLFLYLLTCPELTAIPGVILAGKAALAEALGWSPKGFEEAFEEGSRKGMAKADWKLRLVWLPNALRHNAPENPNVVRHWGKAFDELPECDLKTSIFHAVKGFVKGLGEGFAKAFTEAFREPCPNQEHEPEQEQEQEQEQGEAPAPPAVVARAKVVDPELGTIFAASLLAAGHRVAVGSFAWKDLGKACESYWPSADGRQRHAFLTEAVTRWIRDNDEETSRGWDHREFIRWANKGNFAAPIPAAPPPPKPAIGPLVEVSADMLAALDGVGIVNKSRTG